MTAPEPENIDLEAILDGLDLFPVAEGDDLYFPDEHAFFAAFYDPWGQAAARRDRRAGPGLRGLPP